MSEAPRRKGIRLPWLADDDEAGSDPAAQPQNGQEPVEAAEADQVAPASVLPVAEPPASEAARPFLQSMVDAMQRIAEQARDDAMAKLATAVEERSTETRSTTELRAAELRDKVEADVARIGEWEQGEVQRIREDAAAKVADRQSRLDAQLQANVAAGEGALSVVASRMDAFEQQMAAFFAKLSDVHDPAVFAAAVKQMPSPPALDDVPTARPTGTNVLARARPLWPVETAMPEAPAEPDQVAPTSVAAEVAAEPAAPAVAAEPAAPAVAAEPAAPAVPAEPAAPAVPEAPPVDSNAEPATPVAVEAPPVDSNAEPATPVAVEAPPVDPNAEPAAGEISTQIMVTGLSSFGAITSFKQSLERAAGIRRVSLGLGTSGEFVFTATHAAGFDPTTAIRSFESAAEFRVEDGQLKVSVGANG